MKTAIVGRVGRSKRGMCETTACSVYVAALKAADIRSLGENKSRETESELMQDTN